MGNNMTVHRPDEGAMLRILERTSREPAGAILRLAWMAGLLREEITELTWDQVSFLNHQIELPDRSVPLCPELESFLRWMNAQWGRSIRNVVFSERFRKKMLPQAISRIARRLLDQEGQTDVRLVDLRHDYIIRQLENHPQTYVARVAGIEVRSLQLHFSEYIPEEHSRAQKRVQPAAIDEFKLWKILQSEQDSPAGLALWLTWQLVLTGNEIVALTWDQVDFGENVLHLPDRDAAMTQTIRRMLQKRKAGQPEDSHVLLSENARKPVDVSRLSRMTRTVLIRGGLENVTLRELRHAAEKNREENLIIAEVQKRGAISRKEVMALLGVTKAAAYARLHRLTEKNKLIRVGGKYYLDGTVVEPEKQKETIIGYLEREGFAYRQDIAAVLHVQDKQCSLILRHMVDAGELVRVGQKYSLKEA